jgi:hypothetical protein
MHIPRVGEVWEIKFPNRPKVRKMIGWVYLKQVYQGKPFHCFEAVRYNKGRYWDCSIRGLLKHGKLIENRKPCSKCGQFPVRYLDGCLKCPNNHLTSQMRQPGERQK